MPILTLFTISAKLYRDVGPTMSGKWRISITARLSDHDRLRLTTGEDMKNVVIYVNFGAATAEDCSRLSGRFPSWKGSEAPVGMLHYFPVREHDFGFSPTTLDFEHYITEAQLADLFRVAEHGRFPSRLNIHVADDLGMKYGWEPDGSGIEWDTASSPHVLIKSFSFEITIAEPPAAVRPPFEAVLLPVLRRMLFWQQLTFISVLLIGICLLLGR